MQVREGVAAATGTAALFAAVVAGVMYPLDALPPWAGWALAVVAIAGMVLLVAATVRAMLRDDTEGVERQDAARASMITVLVMVVAGFGYSLLEAFAGLPRVTGAAFAVAAAGVWMIAFTWTRPAGDAG